MYKKQARHFYVLHNKKAGQKFYMAKLPSEATFSWYLFFSQQAGKNAAEQHTLKNESWWAVLQEPAPLTKKLVTT